MAEQTPESLIGSTLTQIIAEKRKLRAIAIDGVEPTLENFERGTYRYEKKLYFVLPSTPSALAQRFVAFLHSPEGQEVLRLAFILL